MGDRNDMVVVYGKPGRGGAWMGHPVLKTIVVRVKNCNLGYIGLRALEYTVYTV